MRESSRRIAGLVLAILVAALPFAVHAEEDDTGWSDTADLSFVATSGNSASETFGFKNTLSRAWERSSVTIKAGGLRVATTARTPVAPDPLDPLTFMLVEIDTTTAENYSLNGRYDRKITEEFFWYTGVGWDRNRFAGIQNRFVVEGGLGNVWIDGEDHKFRTGYALTFTDQEDIVVLTGADDSFAGARFSWAYMNRFGENTEYVNTLVVDDNLDETSDLRADMVNSIAVTMTGRLALKASLQVLFDNQPAFDLVEVQGPAPASMPLGVSVPIELDDIDTIFTTALVINID